MVSSGNIDVEVIESEDNRLKLLLKNVPLAIVNAIRRAAYEEVPTMAVDYVIFRTNTTSLHDEIIAHRLAMIPLKSEEAIRKYRKPEECMDSEEALYREGCYVTLYLEAETGEDEKRVVYSSELRPLDDPEVVPVYSNIPIVVLGPDQRISLEAKARLGRGKEHIKWSPVTVAVSTYVPIIEIDEKRCVGCGECIVVCPKGALTTGEGGKPIPNPDKCNLCRQCVKACQYDAIILKWKEDEYYLTIESSGSLSPKTIVYESVKEIIRKIDELINNLKSLPKVKKEG